MDLNATAPVSERTLRLIRFALFAGVLLLGGAVWLIHRSGERAPVDAATSWTLRLAFLVLLAVDLPAIIGIRVFQGRTGDFQRQGTLAIVAWAIAEGLALLGGVVYLLTARATLYALGTLILAGTFFIVPIPEPPAASDHSGARG